MSPADEPDDGIARHRAATLGELDEDVSLTPHADAADGALVRATQPRQRRLHHLGLAMLVRSAFAVRLARRRDGVGGLLHGQLAVADGDQQILLAAHVQLLGGGCYPALALEVR